MQYYNPSCHQVLPEWNTHARNSRHRHEIWQPIVPPNVATYSGTPMPHMTPYPVTKWNHIETLVTKAWDCRPILPPNAAAVEHPCQIWHQIQSQNDVIMTHSWQRPEIQHSLGLTIHTTYARPVPILNWYCGNCTSFDHGSCWGLFPHGWCTHLGCMMHL